jgi:hypothetical protein
MSIIKQRAPSAHIRLTYPILCSSERSCIALAM